MGGGGVGMGDRGVRGRERKGRGETGNKGD